MGLTKKLHRVIYNKQNFGMFYADNDKVYKGLLGFRDEGADMWERSSTLLKRKKNRGPVSTNLSPTMI